MDNRDFFDEEFDKVTDTNSSSINEPEQTTDDLLRQRQQEDWYTYGGGTPSNNANPPAENRGKKAMWISLVCVGLVLAIIFGWVLCEFFGGVGNKAEVEILAEVLEYLRNNYYQDVPADKWEEAIAAGGTAILQTAGDRYSRLMTPQELYDYLYQVDNDTTVLPTRFGIGIQFITNLGMYVTEVAPDSSSYGILMDGDIIVKLSNVQYSQPVTGQPTEYDLSKVDPDEFNEIFLNNIRSATFHVLRDGKIETYPIERGNVGVTGINPNYQFEFIEFYFNDQYRNVSITNQNKAVTNTKELRHLDQLPDDTGYVRITSFMYYVDDYDKEVTAADEFKQVMAIFKERGLKRLVLDLKDNPGGRVDAATQIVSMLVTDAKLTDQQKAVVDGGVDRNGNQMLLLTTLIPKNTKLKQTTYLTSSYTNYFDAPTSPNALCDVVFWTDGGSASASELTTGALRDYKTGFQIGTTTYGKGIAQSIERLPFYGEITTIDGKKSTGTWAIYYTSASYYSPLGDNIHGKGYTPDDGYNGITDYATLWAKTLQYWGVN